MSGEMNQGNLAGEMISEMQRINPPGAFNIEGNQQPMNMGPVGNGGMDMGQPQMGAEQMGSGQQPVPINPQLKQQFLFVLQQDPQIRQKFADPQIYKQALENPNVMMNTISYFQQQQQMQTAPPPNISTQKTEEPMENDVDDDEKMSNDEEVDDIDLMSSKKTLFDKIMDYIKNPLILSVIFAVIYWLRTYILEYAIKWLPKIQESKIFEVLLISAVFFVSVTAYQFFFQSHQTGK